LAFTIGSTGALTPVPGSPFLTPIPPTAAVFNQPVGIVDTGKFVYTALNGANQIAAYSVNGETGALTPVQGSPFSTGIAPAYVALAGNFLYVVDEEEGSVSAYSINPTTGALTAVPGSPFGSGGSTVTTDVSGQYLYLSRFDGIQGYNIDSATGALTPGAGFLDNDGRLWMTVVQLPPSGARD